MYFPFERWTEKQEKELVWMINHGYSLDCCAKHLGRSELAILYRVDKLNLRRLSREEIERGGKKYIYNGLGKPCILGGFDIKAEVLRPIAEMHKDLDAFERKHGDTYREVFGEYLLSPAKMSVLLSRREKEKQELTSFPEKPKLYFDHSPMYGSVPCCVMSRLDMRWDGSNLKLKIWYHSPKTGVYKSRWVDSDKIHSLLRKEDHNGQRRSAG